MSNKHPHYKPVMDNKTWSEIVKDVDEYYAKHKKHRKEIKKSEGGEVDRTRKSKKTLFKW